MSNHIPQSSIDQLTKGPSTSKVNQVARMQRFIQELLGDTHYTFLQGSYKNDTAISDINDVDIVAVRLSTFSSRYSSVSTSGTVYWRQIFSEIESKLQNQQQYDWTVMPGDKCIRIRGTFNADVVPAVQVERDHLTDPIVVYSFREQAEKLSHPRVHYANGVKKNDSTSGEFKPMVRMFKNWVNNHYGKENDIVSSFKTEALVHSGEDGNFMSDRVADFIILARSITNRLRQGILYPSPILSVCGQEDICVNWDSSSRSMLADQLDESANLAYLAYDANTPNDAERYWRRAFKLVEVQARSL